jgi:hypothetical protein
MFLLNRNKQKTNQNSLIGSIFLLFFIENVGFFRFLKFFFRFFRFVSKQFVSVVLLLYRNREFRLNQNKQKTHPNSLKESIFGNFSENLGLFRFVTKQICLFWLFPNRFETPKQIEIFSFWFHKTNRNKSETGLVSVRTEIYFCLFRGHPSHNSSPVSNQWHSNPA